MQHLPLRARPQFRDVTRALGQAAVGAFSLAPQLVSNHWWAPRNRRDRSDPGAAALHRLSERKSPSPVLNVFEAGNKVRTGIGRWIGYYNADRPHFRPQDAQRSLC